MLRLMYIIHAVLGCQNSHRGNFRSSGFCFYREQWQNSWTRFALYFVAKPLKYYWMKHGFILIFSVGGLSPLPNGIIIVTNEILSGLLFLFQQQISELKKENFGLKLRIYFLEQQNSTDIPEDIFKVVSKKQINFEIKFNVQFSKYDNLHV